MRVLIAGSFTLFDLLAGLALMAILVGLAVLARRRKDQTMLALCAVVAVALVASLVTTHMAPHFYAGPPTGYLRSLWPLSVLVWLVIVLGVVRSLDLRVRGAAGVAAASMGILILVVLNLPRASFGYGSDDRSAQLVGSMQSEVLPKVRNRGQIMVVGDLNFQSQAYVAPLLLMMASDGVDYCLPDRFTQHYGGPPRCDAALSHVVRVRMVDGPVHRGSGTILTEEPYLMPAEREELAKLEQRIRSSLREHDRLVLTDKARRELGDLHSSELGQIVLRMLQPSDGDLTGLVDEPLFKSLVDRWYGPKSVKSRLFTDDPLSPAQWRRWAHLRSDDRTLLVTMSTPS